MKQRQEIIRYIFWGILSAILNIGLFQILVMLGMDYRISNIITLIIVKIFCYVTNKMFVFKTPYLGFWFFLKEFCSFLVARGVAFLIDFLGVIFLVEKVEMNTFIAKCIIAVFVIIINYILSKSFVFCGNENNS